MICEGDNGVAVIRLLCVVADDSVANLVELVNFVDELGPTVDC